MSDTIPPTISSTILNNNHDEVQDNIPPTKQERDDLLRLIGDYVTDRKLAAPISAEDLRKNTEQIIKIASNETHAFLITFLLLE